MSQLQNNNGLNMADVSAKPKTARTALAAGKIFLDQEAYKIVVNRTLPKGDALSLAQMAGVMGAKQTPFLLPLCHPISLNRALIEYVSRPDEFAVEVFCLTDITERTGVEMEAICGLSIALNTIWDLAKPINPALEISQIRLLYKSGGKSGEWTHPDGIPIEAKKLLEQYT